MKNKIIPAILALSLLTACGTDPSTTTAQSTTAAVTEVTATTAETTAAETTETTAETTTTAAVTTTTAAETSASATTASEQIASGGDQTTAASSGTAASGAQTTAAAKKGAIAFEDSLTGKMSARLAKNSDPVKMYIKEKAMGMEIEMDVICHGNKMYMDTTMMGFHTVIMTDGTAAYTIDDESKSYAKTDISDSLQQADKIKEMFDEAKEYGTITDTGKKQFKGKECTYESFESEGLGREMDRFSYYFDENGDLIGITIDSAELAGMEDLEMDFSIKFSEKVSDDVFTVPKGYTEITSTEMSQKMLEKMTGSGMGDLLNGLAQS